MNPVNDMNETYCKTLFGKEADAFRNITIENKRTKVRFIDECVQVSMKVCLALFQNDRALPLFSGAVAANEACPFYCYRITKLKQSFQLPTDEKIEMSQDNCFLLLSLFLNHILLSDINNCFKKVFTQQIRALKITTPTPKKYFQAFLQDEGRIRETLAREAYGKLFEAYLKAKLLENGLTQPLLKELEELANESPIIEYPNFRNAKVYTFPIFGILIYLAERFEEENLTFILKIKMITKQGVEGVISKRFGPEGAHLPAIIFNGIATDGTFDNNYYRTKGQSCPNNFFHHDKKSYLHKKNETCFFCKPKTEGDSLLKVFQAQFDNLTKDFKKLLYLLAADSLKSADQLKKYPKLLKLYHDVKPELESLGPYTFFIVTAHTNTVAAEEDRFHLDVPPLAISQSIFSLI